VVVGLLAVVSRSIGFEDIDPTVELFSTDGVVVIPTLLRGTSGREIDCFSFGACALCCIGVCVWVVGEVIEFADDPDN